MLHTSPMTQRSRSAATVVEAVALVAKVTTHDIADHEEQIRRHDAILGDFQAFVEALVIAGSEFLRRMDEHGEWRSDATEFPTDEDVEAVLSWTR